MPGLMTAVLGSCFVLVSGRVHAVTPDPQHVRGVWEGWGTSLCWWANAFGDRDDLADLMFTTQFTDYKGASRPGLGMTIVRYNAGACSDNTVGGQTMVLPDNTTPAKCVEGFWLNPASSDPASPGWDWSRDANQRAMLLKAKARGADRFQLFSNSPMWWMLKNYNPWGQDDGSDNLASANFPKHVHYLASILEHARVNWGIAFDSVSPFNEPSGNPWAYCNFSRSSQAAFIGQLRAELDSRGLHGIPIAASDETTFSAAIATWNAFSSTTKGEVGLVTVHGYEPAGDRSGLRSAVGSKRVWMSEHGDGEAEGIDMARRIIKDILDLRATAWVYWQALDYGGWGLVQSDIATGWLGSPRDKFYVMAQFSRHIRPGMVILASGDANTVTAYDPAARKLVIVTIKYSTPGNISYDLRGFHQAAGPARRWLTTPGTSERYSFADGIVVSNRQISVPFPADSIQTIEVDNVELSPRVPHYWDGDGSTGGFGTASGTWGTSEFWSTNAAGTATPGILNTTTGDEVNFGSASATLAGGTVMVAGPAQGFKTLRCATANPGRITIGGSGSTLNIAGSTIYAHNAGAPALRIFPDIAGTGGLTLAAGDTQFEGNNTYSGGTTIANGATLRLGSVTALPAGQNVTVQSGGLLSTAGEPVVNLTGTLYLSGTAGNGALYDGNAGSGCVLTADSIILQADAGIGPKRDGFAVNAPISGAFGLVKVNSGTLLLQRASIYTGLTTVNSGTLQLGVNSAIRSGNDVVLNGGTLDLNGRTQSFDSLTGTGSVLMGGGLLTLGAGNSSFTTAAIFSEAGTLTKAGSGTLTLTGTHPFSGTTNVNAGSLLLNGTLSSSPLTVGTGGRLAGDGTLGATAVINGRVSPGDSDAGIITHNAAVTFGAASEFSWQLYSHMNSGGSGTAYDRISAQSVTVTAGAEIDITFNAAGSVVNFTDAFWDTARSWSLITHTGRTGTFSLGSISTDAGGRNHTNYGSFALSHTATAVALTWTPYTAQESWRLQYFGTTANAGTAADTFDANNDGEVNLLEFATGQSPSASTRVATSLVRNGASFEFAYTRSNAALADGLTFAVEWSETLTAGSWSSAGVSEQIQSDNGTAQTVKATVSSGAGKRFLRLKVAGTP